jgi:transcription elongation factor B subunit 1
MAYFCLSCSAAGTGRDVNASHSGVVLEKVVEYFQYWYKYKDKEDVPDMDVPVELCLQILLAADFLRLDRKHHPSPLLARLSYG